MSFKAPHAPDSRQSPAQSMPKVRGPSFQQPSQFAFNRYPPSGAPKWAYFTHDGAAWPLLQSENMQNPTFARRISLIRRTHPYGRLENAASADQVGRRLLFWVALFAHII